MTVTATGTEVLATRLPRADAEEVRRVAHAHGLSVCGLLRSLVASELPKLRL